MSTSWCVKITYLAKNTTTEQLARKFNIPENTIHLPANQEGPNYYARVNNFPTEEAAQRFAQRWNKTRIFSATIKCTAVPVKSPFLRGPATGTASNQDDDEEDSQESLGSSHRPPCRNGLKCFDAKCKFAHSEAWDACKDGVDCEVYFCKANHPFGRIKPCPDGGKCPLGSRCDALHPLPGMVECLKGVQCRLWGCSSWHPNKRPKECLEGKQCHNYHCQSLHPPQRQVCSSGVDCTDLSCLLTHPPARPSPCAQSTACWNFYCDLLHPLEWDPCKKGVQCVDEQCPHSSHPADRPLPSVEGTSNGQSSVCLLKSVEQRKVERKQAALPILAAKKEFCRRLENERILVVTAETGSGKSTQLPQYAAEYFHGLVVCTQPRVIAAVSLARRVADEYDGMGVGRSVGYRVGVTSMGKGNNRVPGSDIVFMTDGSLIQESTEDEHLSRVRVLIIDEAHERSLSTDIVLGMAKLLLERRPKDFYVVISSATIDPTKFLNFFEQSSNQLLQVPGRVFDVTLENITLQSKESVEKHAVSTLLNLYDEHEGSTLVFLPGQREIDQAIELFNRSKPANCLALPLYSLLSPEEQDRVLKFDGGPTKEDRLVVFCTNIAETSLTIENTRLIIDSGLARETRFDNELRLTEMKTMRISRASANQRKGRAGRTAPGHCVRLYEEKELIHEDIEPVILRSSLDLVLLQLIDLQLNPLEFPFLDRPDSAIMEKSLQVLEDLACIDKDHRITHRGELIVKLNFDPRYSAFLLDTYLEHGPILKLVTTIVAILNAPNSLFLIGSNDEEKKLIRTRIIEGAAGYDSDLLYLDFIYHRWRGMGALDPTTKQCRTCLRVRNVENVCRPCRAAHSATYMLNNRILNTIEAMFDAALEVLKSPRWQLEPGLVSDANESDIIGAQLFKYFPEHRGCMLKAKFTSLNGRMIVNNIPVAINDQSAFAQQPKDNPHFLAMSIKRLPAGRCLVEKLHPFRPSAVSVPTAQVEEDSTN